MADMQRQLSRALRARWTEALARFASYLKRRRTRTILACFLVSSALLVAFSGIDLHISGLFFDHGFYMARQGWTSVLHHSVRGFIVLSTVAVVGIYVFNRL
jgi:hypothetical protein